MLPLVYAPYHRLEGRPNVVVDGSPTAGTTLTLSHWPGNPTPGDLAADLSAQIAFRYLDAGADRHGDAALVSNNHFDQDGLVSLFVLSRPEDALGRRALLEDVASAGDFATYRDRRAARIAIAAAVLADPERSPLTLEVDSEERTAQLYGEMLGPLADWCDDPDLVRDQWGDEDAVLAADEALVATGRIRVVERPELDLAVVDVPEDVGVGGGHRFAHQRYDGPHPMALANATGCFALLVRHGRRYRLRYRYESWVTYRSAHPRPRRDLRSLAPALDAEETGGATWQADPPGALEPQLALRGDDESTIPPARFEQLVAAHLRTAPA
ncbi:MAG: DUF6687 family protein, partial [Acidimicrobiales bacterium]